MPDKKLIYVSHSIRGKLGDKATRETMQENNQAAMDFSHWLHEQFPDYKFYVPGEMDGYLWEHGVEPVQIVKGLLALDCSIIDISAGVLMFMPDEYMSSGMTVEHNHAVDMKIPVFRYNSNYITNEEIRQWLKGLA